MPEINLDVVLSFVNEVRASYGFEPIDHLERGHPGRAGSCPISNSIRHGHDFTVVADRDNVLTGHGDDRRCYCLPERVEFWADRGTVATFVMPREVYDFVTEFDAERIPNLIAAY